MNEPTKPDALLRQIVGLSEIKLGSRVTVRPDAQYAAEWPGEYVVVHMVWDFQDSPAPDVNIGIASDDEIKHRCGYTDGFSIDDLQVLRP
jgi:hypothetical protein